MLLRDVVRFNFRCERENGRGGTTYGGSEGKLFVSCQNMSRVIRFMITKNGEKGTATYSHRASHV